MSGILENYKGSQEHFKKLAAVGYRKMKYIVQFNGYMYTCMLFQAFLPPCMFRLFDILAIFFSVIFAEL